MPCTLDWNSQLDHGDDPQKRPGVMHVACVTGSTNPVRVSQYGDWADEPMDGNLVAEVLAILGSVD